MDVLPAIGAAIPGLEDADNLLLGGFEDDDGLPSGSRIFHSSLRLGRLWWWGMALCIAAAVVILGAGAQYPQSPLMAVGGGILGVVLFCGAATCVQLRRLHRSRVVANEFRQGVLVFESGDVVVRLESLVPTLHELLRCCRCQGQEDAAITIEHTYLSRADVELDCMGRAQLAVFFMDVSAKQRKLTVPGNLLREPVDDVAGYINDTRDRSVLDSMRL